MQRRNVGLAGACRKSLRLWEKIVHGLWDKSDSWLR